MLLPLPISQLQKHQEDNGERRVERLLRKLTKRGPRAFDSIVNFCEDCPTALKILVPNFQNMGRVNNTTRVPHLLHPPPNTDDGRFIPLKPYTAELQPHQTMPKFIHALKIHMHEKVSTYNMRSRHRGVLFIVNMINFKSGHWPRHGANADRDNLVWLFRQMDFLIYYYEDLMYAQLEDLIEQLKRSDELRRTDCFVFCLMTHGSRVKGVERVEFLHGESPDIQEIISKFFNDTCEVLRNKPKIFILPYCR